MSDQKSYKQILLAESNLNRHQFFHNAERLVKEVGTLTRKMESIRWLGSFAAVLVMDSWLSQGKPTRAPSKKFSWLPNLLEFITLAFSLWKSYQAGKDKSSE